MSDPLFLTSSHSANVDNRVEAAFPGSGRSTRPEAPAKSRHSAPVRDSEGFGRGRPAVVPAEWAVFLRDVRGELL
ncbi:DUF397 domain-containing protein [Marinactinospora thermotolerans]|uniref:DUF397 domain-containing protein n=1 Tax=Marinactinospora thermotolerans DSM 45154 TaxID=1122192 RepID=A0A1T4PRL0_9ACTN|nr:DUF397 domain-containing protein [Marinactinospora thermotolerans]SJZ94274.1 protein of unknown function [Marinactinospora thermotolerans DSM 45154]